MWMHFLKGLINTRRLYPEFTAPLGSSSDRKRSEEEQNWFACLSLFFADECLSFVTSATDILCWHKNTVSLAFPHGSEVSHNPEVLQNQTNIGDAPSLVNWAVTEFSAFSVCRQSLSDYSTCIMQANLINTFVQDSSVSSALLENPH